jgi:hypothetical protein
VTSGQVIASARQLSATVAVAAVEHDLPLLDRADAAARAEEDHRGTVSAHIAVVRPSAGSRGVDHQAAFAGFLVVRLVAHTSEAYIALIAQSVS